MSLVSRIEAARQSYLRYVHTGQPAMIELEWILMRISDVTHSVVTNGLSQTLSFAMLAFSDLAKSNPAITFSACKMLFSCSLRLTWYLHDWTCEYSINELCRSRDVTKQGCRLVGFRAGGRAMESRASAAKQRGLVRSHADERRRGFSGEGRRVRPIRRRPPDSVHQSEFPGDGDMLEVVKTGRIYTFSLY